MPLARMVEAYPASATRACPSTAGRKRQHRRHPVRQGPGRLRRGDSRPARWSRLLHAAAVRAPPGQVRPPVPRVPAPKTHIALVVDEYGRLAGPGDDGGPAAVAVRRPGRVSPRQSPDGDPAPGGGDVHDAALHRRCCLLFEAFFSSTEIAIVSADRPTSAAWPRPATAAPRYVEDSWSRRSASWPPRSSAPSSRWSPRRW